MKLLAFPIVLLATQLALTGCSAKILSPTLGDEYRREIADLTARLDKTSLELEELKSKLGREQVPPGQLSAEALAAMPLLAGVTLGGTTGLWPATAGDGGCLLRVYVMPEDGRGRFTQIVGSIDVSLVTAVEGCEAQSLCRSFGPGEIRDAWRSGFMGTHYTFEIPVPSPDACEAGGALRVSFQDAISGRTFEHEIAIPGVGRP
ncbi:MAG: hypothetical protein EXS00_06955 [Phycisphaerales bacterium]|nr:hypothetical protein [Phycisphaerales bacterium]